ncbi:MAG TPA: pilus assembly protein TadG-related protein [Bradyrhizobium sp.]|uniref:TadE/TadG family type IV pilus assembly protein n=1 Tax=Bradyrhizobium sp. TaxID=376 RepID=UPI002D802E6A|nr:pilus assembly protein TadG-related protein [Bradyrhizobium sp.]HET7888657.1 pilus assembly protein TadG-related protein [Bradyrhizobium sp.]
MLRTWFYRFASDRKANVAVIFAIMLVPLVFLLGMTLDFTQALRKKEQLDAAADAAAIAAVRPAMLMQSDSVAAATANAIFMSRANSIPGLAATPAPTPTINVVDNGLQRTVTVSYNAASLNNFPTILGNGANKVSWPISGSATSQAAAAPNINWYFLLDDSPSMGIGASLADINNLITYTANQPTPSKSCGFACHETHPNLDSGANSSSVDNLTIAQQKGVTLRIDLLKNALTQLFVAYSACPDQSIKTGVMQCMSVMNNTTYQAALYTFDVTLHTLATLTTPTTAGTKISNISLMPVDHQNCVVSGACNTDYGTDIAGALTSINSSLSAPGLGSNSAGDTPQEVIFLVTDGVEDKIVSGASACPNASLAGSKRCQQPLDTSVCATIKARGIKIAILYTEYLQLKNMGPSANITDSWYMSWVDTYDEPAPDTGKIAQNLQSCASPGFYKNVATGGDITKALSDLFIKVASSTASLTQ